MSQFLLNDQYFTTFTMPLYDGFISPFAYIKSSAGDVYLVGMAAPTRIYSQIRHKVLGAFIKWNLYEYSWNIFQWEKLENMKPFINFRFSSIRISYIIYMVFPNIELLRSMKPTFFFNLLMYGFGDCNDQAFFIGLFSITSSPVP